MIIILDDSLSDRKKYQNLSYLEDEKYAGIFKIYEIIKPIHVNKIIVEISNSKLVCNHKTLQLFDNNNSALNDTMNLNIRENFLTRVFSMGIPRVEFSRGIESNFEYKKIDKELFYSNLKFLLDYYLENNDIELRILFWGANYKTAERLNFVQKMLWEIRNLNIENFENSEIIIRGLSLIYNTDNPTQIISKWIGKGFSKNNIIDEINNLQI
jgi:hypothetical protein